MEPVPPPTNQNASPAVVPANTTSTEQSATQSGPGEGKRLIRTIRPIDVRKLQESGLDRKIAEALSKQKHTILNKSAQLATKLNITAPKGSSSKATIPSNHIKFMKPLATLSNTSPQSSSILNPTSSVKPFKPLPTHSAAQQAVTSASSPTPASPKPLTKKSIIPPKITITGPETPNDEDRQQITDLSPEQRMQHVKSLLHKKILQRQTSSGSEDKPKLYTHLKPPSYEPKKTTPSKSKKSKQILQFPDTSSVHPTDVVNTPNSNQFMKKVTIKPRSINVQQQLGQFSPEITRGIVKDSLKLDTTTPCTNEDKQFNRISAVSVRGFNSQVNQRQPDVSCDSYNRSVVDYPHLDQQISSSSCAKNTNNQANQRGPDVHSKQWQSLCNLPDVTAYKNHEITIYPSTSGSAECNDQVVIRPRPRIVTSTTGTTTTSYQNVGKNSTLITPVRSLSHQQHTKLNEPLLNIMPKLHVKPVTATYSNTKEKPLPQTPPTGVDNSEEHVEVTPTHKLPTKPKTPQKSPQDIARKLDFQTDEISKVSQLGKASSSNFSTVVAHDIIYHKDPTYLNTIPKASVKAPHTPRSVSHETLSRQRIVVPDVSPLKMPFPSANIPQETPLPTIDTFKKPYPLPNANYYNMLPQPTNSTLMGAHTGYISTNYHIQQTTAATNIERNPQNEYNVTPIVGIGTATAPNSLIVLENKVLSQDEMIDLTALRLSKSQIDTPQRFARPHKPIPEVVIKQEKPDDFPASTSTENIQETENAREDNYHTNQIQTKGLVLISANQNKKFIVNASKLKLPPEKIADLAKKIAARTANISNLKTENKNINSIDIATNNTIISEAEKKSDNSPEKVNPVDYTQNKVRPSGNSEKTDAGDAGDNVNKSTTRVLSTAQESHDKILQKPSQIIINSQNPRNFGQKFFLIVKKDPNTTRRSITKPKEANVPEVSPITKKEDHKIVSPPRDTCLNEDNQRHVVPPTINKPTGGPVSFQYSPIKNRKSAVEIIDEPETDENSFSAVDFIASLACSNPITEETQLELSPEELNLNASCAMNFSPLRIPYSPRKMKAQVSNQHRRMTISPPIISESCNDNLVEIGNIVTLPEDSDPVNIEPENLSISAEISDTIVIESSRGRDHVLRKSVEANMPTTNKINPIKVVNASDSCKLGLQKTKDVHVNNLTSELEGMLEASEELLVKQPANIEKVGEAEADICIKDSSTMANNEKESDEASENVSQQIPKELSVQTVNKKESHEKSDKMSNSSTVDKVAVEVIETLEKSTKILNEMDKNSKMPSLEKTDAVETLPSSKKHPDEIVEEASCNLSVNTAPTEYVETCMHTSKSGELIKESASEVVLQISSSGQEKMVETSNENVYDTKTSPPLKVCAQFTAPTVSAKKRNENIAETHTQLPSLELSDTGETIILTDDAVNIKSILKTNSSDASTENNPKDEQDQKIKESSDIVGISKIETKEDTKVPDTNSSMPVPSKRISRFKKGKINLVQRNKPSVPNTKCKTIENDLSSKEVTTALEPKRPVNDSQAVNKGSMSPSVPVTQVTIVCDKVSLVDQQISELSLGSASQSDVEKEGNESKVSESIQPEIRTEESDRVTQVELNVRESSDLNEHNQILLETSKSNESESHCESHCDERHIDVQKPELIQSNSNVDVENSIIKDVDKSSVFMQLQNVCDKILDESTQNVPQNIKPIGEAEDNLTENVQKDISQLINPPKIPKRKSNANKSEDTDPGTPSPTTKCTKQVTVSLVDIVKNPPSEVLSTLPQIPFKRKSDETSSSPDAIKGIRNLLEKIRKPVGDDKEIVCNENDINKNSKSGEHIPDEAVVDPQTLEFEFKDNEDPKLESTKAQDQQHIMATVEEAGKEQKVCKTYIDKHDMNIEAAEEETAITKSVEEADTAAMDVENEGEEFKSTAKLDKSKVEGENSTSRRSNNSKLSCTPKPIRSRRSTRLSLASPIDSTANTTSRCSTRLKKNEVLSGTTPEAEDAKSSKKPETLSTDVKSKHTKEEINKISEDTNHLNTEEQSRHKMKNKDKRTPKISADAISVRTRSTRLSSTSRGVEVLVKDSPEKLSLLPNSVDAEDCCQDNTQDPKSATTLSHRKKLRKTLDDIKKSHKRIADSDDDRDFDIDSTNGCEGSIDFLGFDDTLGSSKTPTSDATFEDEKSSTNVAKSKGGTLKGWLTTGKAISPTPSKDGGSRRTRHAKKSHPLRVIPLKKRWDVSNKGQEETDITDDTSPADDEDEEDFVKFKGNKRYFNTVINSDKGLVKAKKLKLSDGEETENKTFVEPKPIEHKTETSDTNSATPACSGRPKKRPRRRLLSDDFDERESNTKSVRNSKQLDKDESKQQAVVISDKINSSSEETSHTKESEASVADIKKNSRKSVKEKNIIHSPKFTEMQEHKDNPIKSQDGSLSTPKLKSTDISRRKRKHTLEESEEEYSKEEEEDMLEEGKRKQKRPYRRKNKMECAEDTATVEDKPASSKYKNEETTTNTNNDVSSESMQHEKLNVSQISTPQTPVNVKTGRGRYQRRITPENQFNPRLLLITKREQLETDEILTETNPGAGPIQCGLCLKRTTELKWENHLAEHYGVGWKIGDAELNIHYRPSVINIITAYLKDTEIKGLQCRMCQKLYRSGLGLMLHIEVCGAKKQRVECEYCHKDFTVFSFPAHARCCAEKSKQLNQENETLDVKVEVFGATGRAKRYSTLKAESKLKQLGAALVQNNEEPQDFNPLDHIKYNAPLGDDVRQKWSCDIAKFGKGFCPKKTCSYASDKIDNLEDHIKKCKFIMKVGYYCTYCKRRCFDTEKQAVAHINSLHRGGKDFSGSDSDCNIKTDDEQSSNDDDLSEDVDEDEADENELENSSRCKKKNASKSKKTTPSKSNDTPAIITRKRVLPRRLRESIDKCVLQKWKSFLKSNYSTGPLYDSFKCQYSVLKTQEYIKYLPNQEISMKFLMTKDTSIPSTLGEPEADIEWQQVERFKVANNDRDIFLFMGAPITCCSWLPLPANVQEQFLLVAYRKDMFKFTKFRSPKHVKTSLILLKVKQLKVNEVKQQCIEVHYGIAIEDGPIYNVAFLPSGGYNLQDNRLALVAVASVENVIKVYALPIELPQNGCEVDENIPLIKITPSFVLNVDVMTPDTHAEEHILMNPQCLQLCWSEFSGHNHIFASFSNGFIGIWDITNDPQENLNRFEVESVINYAPINYFYVGEKGIKNFALHYDSTGPRWMAVSCCYRKFVIYDIRNFTQPIPLKEDLVRNVVRCLDWSPLWEPVLIGYCDSIPNNGRCVQCVSPVNIMYQQQKLDHMNSAVTAIHYTPVTNTFVASVDNGDVVFMNCREFHYEQPLGRKFGERRVLSCMDIKRLDGKPIERPVPATANQELDSEWTMYEYDYKEKYGLVFKQLTKLNDSSRNKIFNEKRRAPLNITPFMRINTLRCNLNKSAKRLIAMGYENGFIRIFYFDKDSKFCKG